MTLAIFQVDKQPVRDIFRLDNAYLYRDLFTNALTFILYLVQVLLVNICCFIKRATNGTMGFDQVEH